MSFNQKLGIPFVGTLGALVLVFLSIPSALACGGFFCSNFPIDQAGEKIVFQSNGDTVTAVIQIQFTGESEDFSWVLPLPTAPGTEDSAIRVGSEELFVQLMNRTSPRFEVEWDPDGCGFGYALAGADFAVAESAPAMAGNEKVEVLQVKEVGPYDVAVVKSDDPEALSAWLAENDYDQPPEADELIKYYVELGNVFVALKLQQNKGSGDIAPIIVEFDEPQGPCIPLVLTAIAATPDMPVYAWVLGESRTVPKNFFHVGVNEEKINWAEGGTNYVDVVTEAVNEAAGHGFVTDYAGSGDIMKEALVWNGRFDQISNLASIENPRDFYQEFIFSGLPSNTQTLGLLEKYIPPPADYSGDSMSFYNELQWSEEWTEYLDTLNFDPVAFEAEIQEVIVKPILDAQEMLDSSPYMTRLFTTVSADEMNRDPIFVEAPGLPDVELVRKATGIGYCDGPDGTQYYAEITLSSGKTMVVSEPGFETSTQAINGQSVMNSPSAEEVAFLNDTGELEVVHPELVEYYDSVLAFANTEAPPAPGDAQEVLPKPEISSSGGCSQSGPVGAIFPMLALGLLLLSSRLSSRANS